MIIWDDKESREAVFRIEKGFLVKHNSVRYCSLRVVTHFLCFQKLIPPYLCLNSQLNITFAPNNKIKKTALWTKQSLPLWGGIKWEYWHG